MKRFFYIDNIYIYILKKAKEIFLNESNIVPIRLPVTICGDIHGQFYDLMELFKIGGKAPVKIRLAFKIIFFFYFLGNKLSLFRRLCWSWILKRRVNIFICNKYFIRCISLVIALKVRYSDRITLLRGNHESR